MDLNKFERCEPDDPDRCQSVHAGQQCPFKAVNGTIHCPRHGGSVNQQKAAFTSYILGAWSAKFGRHLQDPAIKSVRQELAIMRGTLETLIAKCGDEDELILKAPVINNLAATITKTVETCERMENRLGKVIDEDQAIGLAQELVKIVSEVVNDPDKLKTLSDKIIFAIGKVFVPGGDKE